MKYLQPIEQASVLTIIFWSEGERAFPQFPCPAKHKGFEPEYA